jgi:hypothetical protein
MTRTRRGRARRLAWGLALLAAAAAPRLVVTSFAADPESPPRGISLTPAVVTLKGEYGQSHRQSLRLTNHTSRELSFELVAEDIVATNGQRVFLRAGDRPDSIAATAVFSPRLITIPPGASGAADVVLTVPRGTGVRAVAAIFRGRTTGIEAGVRVTGSLGCLITFSLSDTARIEAGDPEVQPQTRTRNLTVGEWVTNTGTEPVVAAGVVALLDSTGRLVARLPIEPRRLLPGERLFFSAPSADFLEPGRYRALVSLEHDETVVQRTVEFVVELPDSHVTVAGARRDQR